MNLRKKLADALAQAEAFAGERGVVQVAGDAAAERQRVRGAALQNGELGFAQDRQGEPADGILPAPGGGQVALEQGAVDRLGRGAQGRGERAVRTVERGRRVASQFVILCRGKGCIAIEQERNKQRLARAAARRLARRRKRHQAGQAVLFLSVQAV